MEFMERPQRQRDAHEVVFAWQTAALQQEYESYTSAERCHQRGLVIEGTLEAPNLNAEEGYDFFVKTQTRVNVFSHARLQWAAPFES